MNIGRLIITIVVVGIVLFAFDALYHGFLFGNAYKETAESWRSEDEMMARYKFKIVYDLLIATGFCTIWAFGFAQHGIKCGAIYGFFIGLIGTGGMLVNFIFTPIPDQFRLPWTIGTILSSIIAGIVTALVYKPKASAAEPSSD